MATKITQDDILNINRTYLKLGTYAATARELGFSAGTIKKYVKPDFVDPDKIQLRKFSSEIKSKTVFVKMEVTELMCNKLISRFINRSFLL